MRGINGDTSQHESSYRPGGIESNDQRHWGAQTVIQGHLKVKSPARSASFPPIEGLFLMKLEPRTNPGRLLCVCV